MIPADLVTGSKQDMTHNILKMELSLAALSWWFRKNVMNLKASKTDLVVSDPDQNLKHYAPVTVK